MIVVNDYVCSKCANIFEEFVDKKDQDSIHCPLCNSLAIRQIGATKGWLEDFDAAVGRVNRDVKEIDRKVKRGDDNTMEDIMGTKINPHK